MTTMPWLVIFINALATTIFLFPCPCCLGCTADFWYFEEMPRSTTTQRPPWRGGWKYETDPPSDFAFYEQDTTTTITTSLPPVCGTSIFTQNLSSIQDEMGLTGNAIEKQFPWQIFIIVSNGPIINSCSGVLVDSEWILTTTTCIYNAYHDPK